MGYSKIHLVSVPEEDKRGNGEIIIFVSFASKNKCLSVQLKRDCQISNRINKGKSSHTGAYYSTNNRVSLNRTP